jgi:tRNA pseudouridine38-40 synthase
MRVALTLAYDGSSYLGSQIQTQTDNTIFGVLSKVLLKLGIDSKVVASGRTDKGVHATAQVCHFDLPPFWNDTIKLKQSLNKMLPSSIYAKSLKRVSDDFHARYGAKKRSYRYIIRTQEKNPFESKFVTFLEDVDFDTIRTNIALFLGEHDFINFMKTGSDVQSSTRIIYKAFAYRYKDYIVLNFEANGFLRSQIRLMVGALLLCSKEQILDKLSQKQNHKVKPAPSNGLYLSKIKY